VLRNLSWNDLWLTNIQNNVWRLDSSSKMTANTVNRLIQWHLPEKDFMKFRSQIENQVSDYRLLWPSSLARHWSSVVCRPSVRQLTFHILINSSEATGPIWTKLWWNGPWMAPFQNCVWWSWLPTKMAAKLKIEKRGWNFNYPLLV
jgi:hypothetical protein